MSNDHVCHVCGAAGMERDSASMEFEYKGHMLTADVHFHFCDACGAEFGLAVDQRDTARSQNRARKAHDGLLRGEEIKAIRNALGVTQAKAQELFGGGPVSFSKYENDEVIHSRLLDGTLRLMKADRGYLAAYAKAVGVELPLPRTRRMLAELPRVYEVSVHPVLRVFDQEADFELRDTWKTLHTYRPEPSTERLAPLNLVIAQAAGAR